jgi:hypothetical protein
MEEEEEEESTELVSCFSGVRRDLREKGVPEKFYWRRIFHFSLG